MAMDMRIAAQRSTMPSIHMYSSLCCAILHLAGRSSTAASGYAAGSRSRRSAGWTYVRRLGRAVALEAGGFEAVGATARVAACTEAMVSVSRFRPNFHIAGSAELGCLLREERRRVFRDDRV
jgi:hypothetical protein